MGLSGEGQISVNGTTEPSTTPLTSQPSPPPAAQRPPGARADEGERRLSPTASIATSQLPAAHPPSSRRRILPIACRLGYAAQFNAGFPQPRSATRSITRRPCASLGSGTAYLFCHYALYAL